MWTDDELFMPAGSPVTGKKRYKCPCCGGPIDKPLGHNGRPLLSALQQAIFDIVKNSPDGIGWRAVYERVYPYEVRCDKLVTTHIWHINKKIKAYGLQIKGSGGPGSIYHLLRISMNKGIENEKI